MDELLKVYVVMGNDYPKCVFTTEAVADKFCADKKAEQKANHGPRIYWRVYGFPLQH